MHLQGQHFQLVCISEVFFPSFPFFAMPGIKSRVLYTHAKYFLSLNHIPNLLYAHSLEILNQYWILFSLSSFFLLLSSYKESVDFPFGFPQLQPHATVILLNSSISVIFFLLLSLLEQFQRILNQFTHVYNNIKRISQTCEN